MGLNEHHGRWAALLRLFSYLHIAQPCYYSPTTPCCHQSDPVHIYLLHSFSLEIIRNMNKLNLLIRKSNVSSQGFL